MLPMTRLLVGLALTTGAASAAPKIGDAAPAFSAIDSNGKTLRLSDFQGRYVVLEWTNAGCPFVRKHYDSGNMQATQKAAAAQGAVWLSVISSAPGKQGHVSGAQANALSLERKATPTQVLLDEKGELGRLYDAKTTPHLFIVGKDGRLIYAGGMDDIASSDPADIKDATNYVKLALNESMAGKPVSHAVTRPYGCSIKY